MSIDSLPYDSSLHFSLKSDFMIFSSLSHESIPEFNFHLNLQEHESKMPSILFPPHFVQIAGSESHSLNGDPSSPNLDCPLSFHGLDIFSDH